MTAFAYDREDSWRRFFDKKFHHVYRDDPNLTLDEATRAYEAIGYQCVTLECEEVVLDGC